ncbi:MAG: polysaccharide deacetylase family protein [Flavobacteriales bacterium]|nr:polysaccharide deacetylase family protein [Flavobacteriales bacterium]
MALETVSCSATPNRPGAFVISLDFELLWGMRDKRTVDAYMPHFIGARKAIPLLLETFDRHGVKATFATVGLLFFGDKERMLAALPSERPSYSNRQLSPYNGHFDTVGADEDSDPYHFGESLIRVIKHHPAHEIACHTFSHYYCLESGQTQVQFAADIQAAMDSARFMGVELKSLVFPRNQFNPEYLALCKEKGIRSFRGNETNWLHTARSGEQESLLRRGFRLLDAWLNLTGPNCHAYPREQPGLPLNIPSSRFLRPWNSKLRMLEGLRLKRITKAMDHAARTGTIFHLWWHPHNFGVNIMENLAFLSKILQHYGELHRVHGMQSLTMREVVDKASEDA